MKDNTDGALVAKGTEQIRSAVQLVVMFAPTIMGQSKAMFL